MNPSSDPEEHRLLGICSKERFMSLQGTLGRAGAGEAGTLQTMLELRCGAEQGGGGRAGRPALLLASPQDQSGLVCFIL